MNDTQLTVQDHGQVAPAEDFMAVIARAARDPQVDVSKMQQLLEMRERIMAKDAEIAYTEAMNRVQAKVPRIAKTRKIVVKGNLRSKYAALEDIDSELRPLMNEEGFSASYSTEDVPPKATKLILTVSHRMGHSKTFTLVLPIEKTEFRSAVQDAAAAISFGKRQLLSMAFNVVTVDEDRDGNPVSEFISEEQVLNVVEALQRAGMAETDERFLAFAGADKIEHIAAARYGAVMDALKKRTKGQR